jgi:zinc protease
MPKFSRVLLIAAALVVSTGTQAVHALAAEALPTDPSLVRGELDNGLRYIVRQHDVPAGRAVVWTHIHSGSLNETDRQRGIAHYLEHMAFNGSTNFKPGELIPFFQSLGMTFGRDQNAFTSFDQTTYQLSLPDTKPETLDKGLTFFADVINGLALQPNEIENERQIILEERRRSLSGRQRTMQYVMERITPGSLFGFRLPIGTEQTISNVNRDDFLDYYGKWYTPSNATLIVVADADPQDVVKVIREKFSAAPKKPRPTPQELNVRRYDKSFAIVASDPEIRSADVRITKIGPAHPPTTTVEQYRDDLVLRLATEAMNHRLRNKGGTGEQPYISATVTAGDQANAIREAEISARANPGKWKESLQAIALELQRARQFGFSSRELEREKKQIVSAAERAVETEPTTPAQAIVSRINGAVTSGDAILSPKQRLELLNALLPKITPEEVAKRFADEFDPSAVAFVAVLPGSDSIPSESDLLQIGTTALAVKPTPEEETEYQSTLLASVPTPGEVAEGGEHSASGVWSGWLTNNVRVHHKFMDQRKDDVTVTISLIGGELLETAQNRGITDAAQLAFAHPATAKLASTDIREIMTGRKVSVRGGAGGGFGGRGGGRRGGGGGAAGSGDSISLTISGNPDELETGFQLAYLLLTEPKIERPWLTQFQTTQRDRLAESLKNPMQLGQRTAAAAPYPPDEPRVQPLTVEQIDQLTLEAAQAWLERLIKQSPIEVVIVGDMPRNEALDLAAKYLGAIPSRPCVSKDLHADLRKLTRPTGPRVVEKTVQTPTKQAFVLVGFYGADEASRQDVRALNMASRVLSTRMTRQVREEAQLVYSIGAGSRAATTYPGFGVFSAAAPTEPGKADALVAKVTSMYDEFAKSGPTDDEIAVARKQFANTYAEQLKDPSFWAGRLRNLTYRGLSLDDLVNEPEAYQLLTGQQVKDTFAKYYSKDNLITVVVKPQADEPTTRTADSGN